jgi:tRNA pseudouridine55 synthase
MIGFLNINKPAGITSHDVVARIRRIVGRKVKVGHAGTLDPAATGVLPVALGQATRLIEYLAEARKGYRAVLHLGATTTTDDAEGELLEERPVPPLERGTIEAVLAPLRGEIMQVPPMYSALHHQGKRLYELARQGQTIERAPRAVTIDRLELLSHSATPPHLELMVECSKGTYIRALARDIGAALGCGGHLAALERTFVGTFQVEQAVALAALETGEVALSRALLPPEVAVSSWPAVTLSTTQQQRIAHGQAILLEEETSAGRVRAHSSSGKLLALLEQRDGHYWHPTRVFAT